MADFLLPESPGSVRSQSDIYLEKDIFFDARIGQLRSLTSNVVLNFRESILLRLLLADRVRKQAVIAAAWGDNGVIVTEASYHQLVRSLRKKFEEIGLSGNSIKTLPRFGLEYLRENPAPEEPPAAPTIQARPEAATIVSTVPIFFDVPVSHRKWVLLLALLLLPLAIGAFITGSSIHENGRVSMRAIANDFDIHLFDLGGVQSDTALLSEIRRRSHGGEYVYMTRNGTKAWLGVCPGPVQEDFSFCRQDYFSLY